MRLLIIGVWLAANLGTAAPEAQESGSAITGVVRFEGTQKPWKLNDSIDQDKHGGPERDGKARTAPSRSPIFPRESTNSRRGTRSSAPGWRR